MENKEYLKEAQTLFRRVEDKLDELDDVMDYEKADGKLEMLFDSGGSRIVINTQRAIQEIWLAGNARGWHFQYLPEQSIWFAKAEQAEFYSVLSDLVSPRIGKKVTF